MASNEINLHSILTKKKKKEEEESLTSLRVFRFRIEDPLGNSISELSPAFFS